MTKDLTRGRPMGLLLGFGIPVLLGYLFQQLYSVIDTAIVGQILGGAALAAVGSTGAVNSAPALPSRRPSSSAQATRRSCAGMSPAASGCARPSGRC